LREQEQRKLEAKQRVKKTTKPQVDIPHLDEALDALAIARREKAVLRTKPKAAIQWVRKFLRDKFKVVLEDNKQRTLGRRIADRFGGKSPT
jgi:hypothetical protein